MFAVENLAAEAAAAENAAVENAAVENLAAENAAVENVAAENSAVENEDPFDLHADVAGEAGFGDGPGDPWDVRGPARGWEPIPAGLDRMPPGPGLAGYLASIDVSRISGHDRVTVLRAHHRLAAHFQAQSYRAMASVSEYMEAIEDDFEKAELSAGAEIRLALRLTRRAADIDVAFANDLWRRHPRLGEAFRAGEVDQRRARVIVNGISHLPREEAAAIIERVLPDAAGLTTGQLSARIRRLCFRADTEAAAHRYRQAHDGRRMATEITDSGTVNLLAMDLAAEQAAEITRRIDLLARTLKTRGETRTMDQLRADVFCDLLLGIVDPGERTGGGIELRVDLTTLAGLAEHPGELGGYGPVIADIARRVAARHQNAEWRYVITDPDTGRPVHVGTTRRRPNAEQSRIIRAIYPTCLFPGCRAPAAGCDLDHTTPWSESEITCTCTLGPLCPHDHVVRHLPGWTYAPLGDGDHRWISRLGHTYTTSGRSP